MRNLSKTYAVEVERRCEVFIEPDSVTSALAEFLTAGGREKWYGDTHGQDVVLQLPAGIQKTFAFQGFGIDLCNVLDSVHARNDVPVLVAAANLQLHIMVGEHMPPVPALKEWVGELGEGHSVAFLHLVLNPVIRMSAPLLPSMGSHHKRTYVRIPAKHSPYTHSAAQHLEEAHDIELEQPIRIVQKCLLPTRLRYIAVPLAVRGSILPHPPDLRVQRLEIRFLHRSLCPFARSQAAAWVADASCSTTDKRDGMVAVVVEPEEDHDGEEVA
jgi:hypothetical protein